MSGPVVLDSGILSELSRGQANVTRRAREYLEVYGRLTVTAVSVFERLRGYRAALREGRPYEAQLQQFEAFMASCIVLPFDEGAADRAAHIWAGLGRKRRKHIGDILIAATASSRGLPVATRNLKDFAPMARMATVELQLVDWSR